MPRRAKILVINPNSNAAVTDAIDVALGPLRFSDGPEIACITLARGPFGIETEADCQQVAMPLRDLVAADNSANAFVLACYSDPGLHACREATRRPVFGIGEAGVLAALARGERFGVIAIAQGSLFRHARHLRAMGLTQRFAGERPLGVSVAEAAGEHALERMVEVGRTLVADDGADVVVMGCAGMARHRKPLEAALGVPVVDPTLAAVTQAIGAVVLG
jgi:Asp/Glu/hydantoin racemase